MDLFVIVMPIASTIGLIWALVLLLKVWGVIE
jgi:hypothetical protein